ncbi:MAG TPA: cell division protein FtsA [Aestuariivirga sp.]
MTVVQLNGKAAGRGPVSDRRSIFAALDIGSSKISCLIAETLPAKHKMPGASEQKSLKILGLGHQVSRGVRNGSIVDVDEAERAIRLSVDAAERMAQQAISEVYVNVSGGRPQSTCYTGQIMIEGNAVSPRDLDTVIGSAVAQINPSRRTVLHLAPIQYHIDDASGIMAPLGMHGESLSIDLGVVTADSAHLRNLALAIERAHLSVKGYVIAPYAAGKAVLAEDEMVLGTVLIEMGGATTGISIFHEGNLVFADSIPVGGMHVTNDIARGLSTTIAHAERMKTLWGSALPTSTDEREMLSVPLLGERGVETVQKVPRAMLTSIIRPRIDEIFELVAERLNQCPVAHLGGQRVVLSGGASQLTGVCEVASLWLGRQVRPGTPKPVSGMPDAGRNPGFSVAVGLLAYGLKPDRHCALPAQAARNLAQAQQGYVRRVGRWIADSF